MGLEIGDSTYKWGIHMYIWPSLAVAPPPPPLDDLVVILGQEIVATNG